MSVEYLRKKPMDQGETESVRSAVMDRDASHKYLRWTAICVGTVLGMCSTNLVCSPAQAHLKKKTVTELQEQHPQTAGPSIDNFNEGMRKLKEGDVDGAIDGFKQAVYFARNNYYPNGYYWLGVAYFEKNTKEDDIKCIDAVKHCIKQSMDHVPNAWLLLAETYLRDNNLDEAEMTVKTAVTEYRSAEKAGMAHWIYGQIMEKKNANDEAYRHYAEAISQYPGLTKAQVSMAEVDMKQKRWPQAMKQWTFILANAGEFLKNVPVQKVYVNRGRCFLAKGDHQSAIDDWHKCLELNPDNADAHLELAKILDSEDHLTSAIKEYKEFIRTGNDQFSVTRAKERIAFLEQKLQPPETDPERAKPSLEMRREAAEADLQAKKEVGPYNSDPGF